MSNIVDFETSEAKAWKRIEEALRAMLKNADAPPEAAAEIVAYTKGLMDKYSAPLVAHSQAEAQKLFLLLLEQKSCLIGEALRLKIQTYTKRA